MKNRKRRLSAAICTLTMLGTCLPLTAAPQTVTAADTYQTRDPFFNFNSGYNYYTSEHFQFIWGNSGDASQVTQDFLKKNADSLERCWDVYVNKLGMTECAESVETYMRDGNKYKLNIYISGTGLSGMEDDWAYMSWDSKGYPYLFTCVGAMRADPPSWVMPHEFGHAITAHQLGWNRNKYSNTWWEALGNWFREQWIYEVSSEYGWSNSYEYGYGTDFFETYLKNLCFTSPFGRDYYSAWVLLQYLTENPDNMEGYGAEFVKTMLQNGKDDEYPLTMINRLAPADMKETLGNFAKRMATLDLANQTAYRKRLDALFSQGAWNWQQIYTMLDPVDGEANVYAVPTERAPQASGLNIVPLDVQGGTVTVTLDGRSPLSGADWRGCIVFEDSAGKSHYSELIADGQTVSMAVPQNTTAAYLTVIATPDESLYCPSGLHWHNDSDEFGETKQPFSSKYRYPYQVTIEGAGIKTRPLNMNGRRHANGGGFVANSAHVDDSVYVGPNAAVIGNATVTGNAIIDDYAMIAESATISGNAYIGDSAMVMGNAKVSGNAKVLESACIWGNYTVSDNAVVKGVAFCMASGSASGQAIIDGDYYDDGGNKATKGACFGWYGTQTYLDARPYTDGQYLNYTFDTDSSQVIADQYTSTYALPQGAAWEANRTGANGVMTLDGKDDFIDIDDSFGYFGASAEYQFGVLWRGGAVNQKLLYLGDAEHYLSFTPKNDQGYPELVLKGESSSGSTETRVLSEKQMEPGTWYTVRIQIENNKLTLHIADSSGDSVSSMESPVSVTLQDIMSRSSNPISTVGKGWDGDYFNGSIDFMNANFKTVSAPAVTYTEKEEITEHDPQTGEYVRGDVDVNGVVDVLDAVLLARVVAEDTDCGVTDQGKINGDMNRDGRTVAADLTALIRVLAGLDA
ncbi:MAG: hypothetical protein IJ060_00280 [Oscillospiraceae bacterium]|nr:hypothetical protein [Oscillospiraceae bacterium]